MKTNAWLSVSLLLLSTACATATDAADPENETAATEDEARVAVSIRVPLVESVEVGRRRETRLLADRNDEAESFGIEPFPKYVTITARSGTDPFTEIQSRVDELNEHLSDDRYIEMVAYGSPYEYAAGTTKFCYTGDAHKAMDLMLSTTDSVLSDQFVLHGWRYKNAKFYGADGDIHEEMTAEDEAEMTVGFPDIWNTWRGTGEAILTLNSVSDGGEESLVSIIPRCAR